MRRVLLLCLLSAASGTVFAQAVNCDGELNASQKEQRTWCTTFAPCAFVFNVFDSCTEATKFLSRLGLRRAQDLDEGAVSVAARGMSVELPDPDAPDAPSLKHCLSSPDRTLCRRYLGIEQAPIRVAAEPRKPTLEEQQHSRMLVLYKEEDGARHRSATSPWTDADLALEACAAARQQSDRDRTCQYAQKQVDVCQAARVDWDQRKSALLTEIRAANPSLGQNLTPGISPLRGIGRQANADEMWNDTVAILVNKTMPACSTTLPNTALSPAQALAQWQKEDAAPPAAFAAASGQRRQTSFGASLAQGAIVRTEQEERNPAAAEARRRQEAATAAADRQARAQYNRDVNYLGAALAGARAFTDVSSALSSARSGADAASTVSSITGSIESLTAAMPGGDGAGAGAGADGSSDGAGDAGTEATGGGSDPAVCKAEDDKQQARIATMNAQLQGTKSVVTASQGAMYMIQDRLRMLDKYCRVLPQYREYAALKSQFAQTQRACQSMASNSSDCVPRRP